MIVKTKQGILMTGEMVYSDTCMISNLFFRVGYKIPF